MGAASNKNIVLPSAYAVIASPYFCINDKADPFREYPFAQVGFISMVLLASCNASSYLPAFTYAADRLLYNT